MSRCTATAILIALASSGRASVVRAGNNVWTPAGPDGGIITVLKADPTSATIVYAGASLGGAWKSSDAGSTWTQMGSGVLLSATVSSFAVSPSNPTTVYAGTTNAGAFRTTDGGSTWSEINSFPGAVGAIDVESLAVDSGHSTTVYAGLHTSGGVAGGLYKTTDGGATWKLSSSGLPSNGVPDVNIVRIDPTDATDLFVAAGTNGVFRSTDSGATWHQFCDDSLDGKSISDLVPFSAGDTVFALSQGLYKSVVAQTPVLKSEAGDFQQVQWQLLGEELAVLAIDYPEILEFVLQILYGHPLAGPASLPALYLGSLDKGMAKSTDGGSSWSLINSGLPSFNFEALAVDPADQNVAYTGGQGDGIYKTTNGGSIWKAASQGLTAADVAALAVAPSNSSIIYAGLASVGGVRRSTDGGTTWSARNGGVLGNLQVNSIAVDPLNPLAVEIEAEGFPTSQRLYSYFLYRSTDGGTSWTESDAGVDEGDWISALAVAPSDGSIVYGVSSNDSRIYKSTDSGASWKEQAEATNLVANPLLLAVNPTSSSTVYVGTSFSGIFRTTDGGTTWTNPYPSAAIRALAVDPSTPSTVYAGKNGGAVLKSTDSGAHWSSLTAGLLDPSTFDYASPNAIVVDPANSTNVYLAAPPNSFAFGDQNVIGFFASHDSGNTWSSMSSGLSNFNSTSLAIAPDGISPTLYLGTRGAGVQAFKITAPPGPRQAGGIGVNPIRHVGGRG